MGCACCYSELQLYSGKYRSQFEYVTHFYMACGSYIPSKYVGVLQYKLDGVTYYFIDNQEYFNCFVPYGDMRYDIEKFTFFDKAVLSMLPLIGFRPDIIHCHDWQAGLIPVYLKNEFQADSFFWGIRSIMTIHNLKFQGIWDVKPCRDLRDSQVICLFRISWNLIKMQIC